MSTVERICGSVLAQGTSFWLSDSPFWPLSKHLLEKEQSESVRHLEEFGFGEMGESCKSRRASYAHVKRAARILLNGALKKRRAMNVKCSVYIATSVDGFVAKPDGDINWLHRPEYAETEVEGLSYADFISTVDAIVMGRHTFEKVLSIGIWPYEGTPVIVLSGTGVDIPENLEGKVRVESGSPEEIVARLGTEGKRHLYIDGGITIQRFLRAGLIHEMTITIIPVLLGAGIPLFESLGVELPLCLVEATRSDNGFVQVRYEVVSSA